MDYVLDGVDYSFVYAMRPAENTEHTADTSLFLLDVPDNIALEAKEVGLHGINISPLFY